MKLLLIEDNPLLASRMKQQLRRWYLPEIALSGDAGLDMLATSEFDCVLLDLGLPDSPGKDICQRIRLMNAEIPVLVVTGNDTSESQVELLNAGADDYITKPFDLSEMHARINALLRRRARSSVCSSLTLGDLSINTGDRTVQRAGQVITLRKKEFDILEYLVSNAGRVLSRQMIINHAWSTTGKGWIGSVDVHIKQLRDKIDKPFSRPLIKTCYGVGYMATLAQPHSGDSSRSNEYPNKQGDGTCHSQRLEE